MISISRIARSFKSRAIVRPIYLAPRRRTITGRTRSRTTCPFRRLLFFFPPRDTGDRFERAASGPAKRSEGNRSGQRALSRPPRRPFADSPREKLGDKKEKKKGRKGERGARQMRGTLVVQDADAPSIWFSLSPCKYLFDCRFR